MPSLMQLWTTKYSNISQYDSIINLQGDMPIINPKDIEKVNIPLEQGFDIGTLATNFKNQTEIMVIKKHKIFILF